MLTDLLRQRYMSTCPDLVSVVLDAHGFADLLERMEFLQRIQDSDTRSSTSSASPARDAGRETLVLTKLESRRQAETIAGRASATRSPAWRPPPGTPQRARPSPRRAPRRPARHPRRPPLRERTLRKLLADRARAAVDQAGPGGPWSIPWAIVQCESGGQNLPPNSAGASGYYQIMPATWGDSAARPRHAYKASKAEQDRLAAQLWNGGAGASNWVCAALVGVI